MELPATPGPGDVSRLVRALADVDPAGVGNAQLRADVLEWVHALDAGFGQFLRWLAEFDQRNLAGDDGLRAQEWLRHHAHLAPRTAHSDLLLARRVHADPGAPLASALAGGHVNATHGAIIDKTLTQLPESVRVEAEDQLVAAAVAMDPADLMSVVHRLKETVIPETLVTEEREAFARRYLNASATLDGMVAVDGLLDPAGGAVVLAFLHTAGQVNGPDDVRSSGQRRHDALVTLAGAALDSGQLPVDGGERPHVELVVDLGVLLRQGGFGHLPDGTPVSFAEVLRWLCDAQVTRVVLAGVSEVLDVGRSTRVVSRAMRRALKHRDGGCIVGGCRALLARCHAHHIVHWAWGGPTCLENLVLLCERHHHDVHDGLLLIVVDGKKFKAVRAATVTTQGPAPP